MHYAGGVLSSLFNNICFTDPIPIFLSILGNIFTTSEVTYKQFSCKFLFRVRSSTMFNTCCVSCILVSIFRTFGKRHFSIKINRFPTAVPLEIILTGLLSLWVFIILYILPGFTSFSFINRFQSSSMALRLFQFSIHLLILLPIFFVKSLLNRVNELLFIWCWTFLQYCSLLNKTNFEPLSWTLIVWWFKERNSCKDFLPQLKDYCEFLNVSIISIKFSSEWLLTGFPLKL